MEFSHISVLYREALDSLDIKPDGIYVDCTAGGGGHSEGIVSVLGENGLLISIDCDDDAIAACHERLDKYGGKIRIVKSRFSCLDMVLDDLGIDKIDGILWDLGVSSHQLDDADRGFSYSADAPLDMRMDREASVDAAFVVNNYDEGELRRVISEYGEEKFASSVARAIVRAREEGPVTTTFRLAEIVKGAIPAPARRKEKQHPARRTFQAIRIEVNHEMDELQTSLDSAIGRLREGGRAVVISFHSLEDRIVKKTFAKYAQGCTCPPEFPVCVCGRKPTVKLITSKPVIPDKDEITDNSRARSSKLRVAQKL